MLVFALVALRAFVVNLINQVITSHHSSSHLREQVSDIIEIKKAGSTADVVVRLMLEEKTKAVTLYVYEAINIGVGASVAIAVDETMEE